MKEVKSSKQPWSVWLSLIVGQALHLIVEAFAIATVVRGMAIAGEVSDHAVGLGMVVGGVALLEWSLYARVRVTRFVRNEWPRATPAQVLLRRLTGFVVIVPGLFLVAESIAGKIAWCAVLAGWILVLPWIWQEQPQGRRLVAIATYYTVGLAVAVVGCRVDLFTTNQAAAASTAMLTIWVVGMTIVAGCALDGYETNRARKGRPSLN